MCLPICGDLLKFCDKFTAFLEARISIAHGISSPDLVNGSKAIYDEIHKEVCGMDVTHILQEFI